MWIGRQVLMGRGEMVEHHSEKGKQVTLNELPNEVLDRVAQQLRTESAAVKPLLAASKGGLDSVLRTSSKITLSLGTKTEEGDQQPLARLLHRACCTAAAGLSVSLNLGSHGSFIGQLLQPGIKAGGWTNVHNLKIDCTAHFPQPTPRLSRAFPSLNSLHVDMHGQGVRITSFFLESLTHLSMRNFCLSESTVLWAIERLACLPNLKSLDLGRHGYLEQAMLSHVTGLTSLTCSVWDPSHFIGVAQNNSQLQHLSMTSLGEWLHEEAYTEMLQGVLEACPSLTDLDLQDAGDLGTADLDVILQHAPNLTSLSGCAFELDVNLSDRPCKWKKLQLGRSQAPNMFQLAHLPLRTVETFSTRHLSFSQLAIIELPLMTEATEEVLVLLRQAASNLAGCPAWKKQPASDVYLRGDTRWDDRSDYDDVIDEPDINFEQRIQLMEALAPLAGPHLTNFTFDVGELKDFSFCWKEVEALGRTFGNSLTHLQLGAGVLHPSFWTALDEELPHLEEITLTSSVVCSESDIAIYCSRRAVDRPLSIDFNDFEGEQPDPEQLFAALMAWGVEHVDIMRDGSLVL